MSGNITETQGGLLFTPQGRGGLDKLLGSVDNHLSQMRVAAR